MKKPEEPGITITNYRRLNSLKTPIGRAHDQSGCFARLRDEQDSSFSVGCPTVHHESETLFLRFAEDTTLLRYEHGLSRLL